MTWLVTGGAGYIGAHVVAAMRAAGHDVVVIDDLTAGIHERVGDVPVVVGTVLDASLVARTLREHRVSGVVHLAARKSVEESVRDPLRYYRENVEGLRVLLEAVTTAGTESFVFSSSAAVYGEPDVEQVDEDVPCVPVNPYGRTKLIGEGLVADVARTTGLRYASLRYFNVAGAAAPVLADRAAGNLVPMVLRRIAARQAPVIFGGDYPTPDGTCIRDFVHVEDVAGAHVATCAALASGRSSGLVANIGRGQGVSVREMVDVIREVTGTAGEEWAEPRVLDRRPGDPARVVASPARFERALGWRSRFGVRDMVGSAWAAWVAGGIGG